MARASSRRTLQNKSRTTRAKATISYAEPSSDSDLDLAEVDEDLDELDDAPRPMRPRRYINKKVPTPPAKRHRRASSSDPDSILYEPVSKKRKSRRNSPTSVLTTQVQELTQSTGVIPPWQTLPYAILLRIFEYASYPLYNESSFQPLPSVSWLLKMARLCKAFTEPALTALYTSPPLLPMAKAHNLVNLLRMDPASLSFGYRAKIESLRIDAGQVAALKLSGSGYLDLFGLVQYLPRLKDLEFYHQSDMAPYRDLSSTIKWSYPESLFDALEYVNPAADPSKGDKTSVCKLRSWRWSSRLAGKKYPLESIREIHLKPSFSELRKVAFVNYSPTPHVKKREDEPPKHEETLANALSVLKNLEYLIFETSTLVNGTLLPLLPKNLQNLELINCWEVSAEHFEDFLITHGSQLRSLTLNHNVSLSLAFLPVLGSACPQLQALRMNLTYYSLHSFYHDAEPGYDELLLPSQVPTWPSALQVIELTQLRKWESGAAEMFFQSLLDSASNLPDLRKLTIQAILNGMGWRERAIFRDKWNPALDRVFKRVFKDPEPLVSVSAPVEAVPTPLKANKQLDDHGQGVSQVNNNSLRSRSDRPLSASLTFRPSPTLPPPKSASSTRRTTRASTRRPQPGKYVEETDISDEDEGEGDYEPAPEPDTSARELARKTRAARELAVLKATAGKDGQELSTTPPETESDDDTPLVPRKFFKGKAKEFIQGMCEVVDVRIDNLRPRETHVTEADFLDEEAPGDGDWNGDDDVEENDSHAW